MAKYQTAVFVNCASIAPAKRDVAVTLEYIVFTPMMKEENFFMEVDYVINVLRSNGVHDIEMFYGWSWGEWETFHSAVDEIKSEIRKQEEITGGRFGENDVYITIDSLETQIIFCHEADIHIEFNKVNGVVADILNSWKLKGIVHCVRRNKTDILFEELPL